MTAGIERERWSDKHTQNAGVTAIDSARCIVLDDRNRQSSITTDGSGLWQLDVL